jgi:hypothetical protein
VADKARRPEDSVVKFMPASQDYFERFQSPVTSRKIFR